MNECSCIGIYLIMKKDKSKFKNIAYLLKSISNETKLCVIMQLMETPEKTVTQLIEDAECNQSLLSHHINDMRAKGILDSRKEGKNCFYKLRNRALGEMVRDLYLIENNE